MSSTDLIRAISDAEDAREAARRRGERDTVARLSQQIADLWADRRAELARQTHTRAADWSRTLEWRPR